MLPTLPDKYLWVLREFEPEGDAGTLGQIATELDQAGNLEGAAMVYDRAFGLDPLHPEIARRREELLDRLQVVEHGLTFRYVPGGVFLMGANFAEPDEEPWHPVWLSPFWISDAPISWTAYRRIMDWPPPPQHFERPRDPEDSDDEHFMTYVGEKLRWYYSIDMPEEALNNPAQRHLRDMTPETFDTKPMVGVSWSEVQRLCRRITTPRIRYTLPTEAQWEKAARGGRIGSRHAWGDAPASAKICDFDSFRRLSVLPTHTFAPNGYGLYAMNGCVWEWTADWYDRDYYRESPREDPTGPPDGREKVLRGGSWADCAEVVTVTYRMSRVIAGRSGSRRGSPPSPTIGFRLCRMPATVGL